MLRRRALSHRLQVTTMPAFLFRLALLLFLLMGCRTTSPAPQPPDPEIDELLQQLRADPDDSPATYDLAARYAALGEKEPALQWMKRLEELRDRGPARSPPAPGGPQPCRLHPR